MMTENQTGSGLNGRKTPEEIFNMPIYPVNLDSIQQPFLNTQQRLFNAQLASVLSPNSVPVGSFVPFGDLNTVAQLPGAANLISASIPQKWSGRAKSKRSAKDDKGFDEQADTGTGRCNWDDDDATIDLFEAVSSAIAESQKSRPHTSSSVGCVDWKKVSHWMAFKGYNYSPQQCKARHANVQATYKAAAHVMGPHGSGLQPWENMSSEERKARGFKIPNFSKKLFDRLDTFFGRRADVTPVHIVDGSAPRQNSTPVAFDESSNLETNGPTDQATPDMQSRPISDNNLDENREPPEGDLQTLDDADDGRMTDGSTKANMVCLNNSPIQAGFHAALRAKKKKTSKQDELVLVARNGQELAAKQQQEMIMFLKESDARALAHYDKVANLQQAFLNQAAAHHTASLEGQQKLATTLVEGLEKSLQKTMETFLKVASLGTAPAPPPASTSAPQPPSEHHTFTQQQSGGDEDQ